MDSKKIFRRFNEDIYVISHEIWVLAIAFFNTSDSNLSEIKIKPVLIIFIIFKMGPKIEKNSKFLSN
jgi:hypothetical protein